VNKNSRYKCAETFNGDFSARYSKLVGRSVKITI